MKVDKSKLPRGVLDGKELEEILKEETGLEEAIEGKIDRQPSAKGDKDYDLLLRKTETIEKEITSVKSETAFLREKLREQSNMLLELTKLVKELTRETNGTKE